MYDLQTWRKLIALEMEEHGESFRDVESCTLTDAELDVEFDSEGKPFTAWTRRRVYFPTCYDGEEGVRSVSRNPDGRPTEHVGGG